MNFIYENPFLFITHLELMQRKKSFPRHGSEDVPPEVHHLHAGTQVHERLAVYHPHTIAGQVDLPEREKRWELVGNKHGQLVAAEDECLQGIVARE